MLQVGMFSVTGLLEAGPPAAQLPCANTAIKPQDPGNLKISSLSCHAHWGPAVNGAAARLVATAAWLACTAVTLLACRLLSEPVYGCAGESRTHDRPR